MTWKLSNAVHDPANAMRRRMAARMSSEPMVCGRVLRARESIVVTDEQYDRDKERIEKCIQQGVLSAERIGGAPAPAEQPVVVESAPEELSPPPVEDTAPEASPEPETTPAPSTLDEDRSGKKRKKKSRG